jgi:hypothetical protein
MWYARKGYGLDTRLERDPPRPSVRLTPSNPKAGALTIGFSKFSGINLRLGHWFVLPIPFCGCDACDETAEHGEGELNRDVSSLISGQLREWIHLPIMGDAWYGHGMPKELGRSRLPRAEAKARIETADGKTRFDSAPWPLRSLA